MKDIWEFVARPPRLAARALDNTSLAVHHEVDGRRLRATATLCDFSRGGIRFACDAPLRKGATVEFELTVDDFRLEISGVVRWRCEDDEGVTYGCQFTEEVPWEVLGELLLREILSPD